MKQIYHPWFKWECYKSGFYETTFPGDGYQMYRDFLSDVRLFESQIQRVFRQWIISCENFLTNDSINRIAWIGQASMCIYSGVPNKFRSGFHLLTQEQKVRANDMARLYLEKWIQNHEQNI